MAAIPDGPAKDAGIAAGETAADAMLSLRANDGWNIVVPYTPLTDPGHWRPTPPDFRPAAFVGWGDVAPFAIHDSARFRLNPPPLLHTAKYADDYEEVKALGGIISTSRPADRADVARFYAAVLPMPLWPAAARQVSAAQGKTLSENAREFAWLAMAVCDGLIASMKMKYHYNFWRPVTAIREGETDGNPRTVPDGGWESFVFTPPYPSYPGNHATAAGAARAVLEHVYGRDGHVITLTSQAVPTWCCATRRGNRLPMTSTTPASMAEFTSGSTRMRGRAWDGRSARTCSRTCSVLCLGDRLTRTRSQTFPVPHGSR